MKQDITYFLLMVQYLVPGLVLAGPMITAARCGLPSGSTRRPMP